MDQAEGNVQAPFRSECSHIPPLTPHLPVALGCVSYARHNTPKQGNLPHHRKIPFCYCFLNSPPKYCFCHETCQILWAPSPPAHSAHMGFPTALSPALTAPSEVSGKTLFGFSRSGVWPILNAIGNPSLKDKKNKHRITWFWDIGDHTKGISG